MGCCMSRFHLHLQLYWYFFNDLNILYNCVFFVVVLLVVCCIVSHIELSCTILLHTSITKKNTSTNAHDSVSVYILCISGLRIHSYIVEKCVWSVLHYVSIVHNIT